MSIHVLKTWPAPFEAMRVGRKTFEYRLNDRNFQVGDHLVLQEYNPETDNVTGEALTMRVVYLLHGGKFGIPPKHCVMSVEPWDRAAPMPSQAPAPAPESRWTQNEAKIIETAFLLRTVGVFIEQRGDGGAIRKLKQAMEEALDGDLRDAAARACDPSITEEAARGPGEDDFARRTFEVMNENARSSDSSGAAPEEVMPTAAKRVETERHVNDAKDGDTWLRGYACALADLNRLFDEPTSVAGTMVGGGITIDMLRRAGVESYDLDELKKCAGRRSTKVSGSAKGGSDG